MAAVLLFRAQMAAVTSCEDDPLVGQKNRATFLHQSIIFAIFMIKGRQTLHFNDKRQTKVRNSLMLI